MEQYLWHATKEATRPAAHALATVWACCRTWALRRLISTRHSSQVLAPAQQRLGQPPHLRRLLARRRVSGLLHRTDRPPSADKHSLFVVQAGSQEGRQVGAGRQRQAEAGRGRQVGSQLCREANRMDTSHPPRISGVMAFSTSCNVWVCECVLCCVVLCCAVLCCAVQCCAVLCCAVLLCCVLCCAVLCCVLYCVRKTDRDSKMNKNKGKKEEQK
jgi:hypothetical protein